MGIKRAMAAAAVGLGMIAGVPVLTAGVASAADGYDDIRICGTNHDKVCGYGGVTNSRSRVYACDTYSDNAGFRTAYVLTNGVEGSVDDANGSSSGCSDRYPGTIYKFRVILKATGGWVYGPWKLA